MQILFPTRTRWSIGLESQPSPGTAQRPPEGVGRTALEVGARRESGGEGGGLARAVLHRFVPAWPVYGFAFPAWLQLFAFVPSAAVRWCGGAEGPRFVGWAPTW